MCARRQAEIMDNGAKMVRPGGRLVYSTCTFAPEEDEMAVAAFLERNPDFEPEIIAAPWFEPVENGGHRMWPHKLLGEGHFAAVLKKQGDDRAEPPCEQAVKLPKEWLDFAEELDITLPAGKALLFGQSLYWAPEEMPSLRGLKVERPGLELGVLKKGRFEPAHALALWLKDCKQTVSLPAQSRFLAAYMAGNVIPSDLHGWTLVQADGYSIGWAKGDGTVLKNHYPKGLRRPG